MFRLLPVITNWKTGGIVVEQVVRPTGLDPPIEIRPSINQIDDLLNEIDKRVKSETACS